MKHKKINIYLFDDENKPLYLPKLPTYYYHVCCDCGLRHIVTVERYKQGIRIGFARDHHATEEIREFRKIKVTRGDKNGL